MIHPKLYNFLLSLLLLLLFCWVYIQAIPEGLWTDNNNQ